MQKAKQKTLPAKRKQRWPPSQPKLKLNVKMPKKRTEDEPLADSLLSSLQEVLAHVQGKITLKEVVLPERLREILPAEIKSLRDKMNVSQAVFASILNVPTVTAISWEKGRRKPTGAALRLLDLARKDPQRILELAHPSKTA